MTTPTVCLTMIVGNERDYIIPCLNSCVEYLDYWCIHDTGSTDGTQDRITEYFADKNIPGEMHSTPWRNFGHNRTLAIQDSAGKADYYLLLDAKMHLIVNDLKWKNKLRPNIPCLIRYEGALDYQQILLVPTNFAWCYRGVTYEYIICPNMPAVQHFHGISIKKLGNTTHQKIERNIQLLLDGLKEEPNNSRYLFYLAQSYKDLKKYPEAISYYQKRLEMGGWLEECYFSAWKIGYCQKANQQSFWDFMPNLLIAYAMRPTRLEALHTLMNYCQVHKLYKLCYQIGSMGIENKYPTDDFLFIDRQIHDYKFWDELSMCSYYARDFVLAHRLIQQILVERKYPVTEQSRLQKNLDFMEKALTRAPRLTDREKNIPFNTVPRWTLKHNQYHFQIDMIFFVKADVITTDCSFKFSKAKEYHS